MKEWLLVRSKSPTNDNMELEEEQDEAAGETENDDDTSGDHEDAKLRDCLKNMLDKNNLTYRDLARMISKSTGEEVTYSVIYKLFKGMTSFKGPQGKKRD